MKIYAMSDVHGYLDILKENIQKIDLSGDNKLILLGDYIDYGPNSRQTLEYIFELEKEFGSEKITVLQGNHEAMFLEWIDEYQRDIPCRQQMGNFNSWLKTDSEQDYRALSTFLSDEQMKSFRSFERKASFYEINYEAVALVKETYGDIIRWLRQLKLYYETDDQIFVHAGVDEEAGEDWRWGTSDDMFLWKYPVTTGSFYKTIISGHVGTSNIANEPDYHGVYFDGESHYFIDGSVQTSGRIPILIYDGDDRRYYELAASDK